MKANLKGLGGAKGFFLLHGEKLLMAVVAVAAGLLVFSALRVERLEDTYDPKKLDSQVQTTRTSIEDTSKNNWTKARQEYPDRVKFADPQPADLKSIAVPIGDYETSYPGGLFGVYLFQHSPRPDPKIIAAEGLRAVSG